MKISKYTKELPPRRGGGRTPTKETLELIEALRQSATEKPGENMRYVRPGAGETVDKLRNKLLAIGARLKGELHVKTRVDGEDVVFWAVPWHPDASDADVPQPVAKKATSRTRKR